MKPIYKRLLLKLSGEVLAGEKGVGIDFEKVLEVCESIKECVDMGVQVAIVVGGGNFWRGRAHKDMDRCTADHIGMLGTTMNALTLQDGFKQVGVESRVQTGIEMRQIAEFYIKNRATRHLEKDRIVIFGCGTGSPFFTTDTASALRASEINAEVMLMAKNGVDGIYDDDPKTNPNAKKLDKVTYDEIIKKDLKVMDTSACALCKQNKIPINVFDFKAQGSLVKIMNGEEVGTYVSVN
mgnify:CR=1 FL=1